MLKINLLKINLLLKVMLLSPDKIFRIITIIFCGTIAPLSVTSILYRAVLLFPTPRNGPLNIQGASHFQDSLFPLPLTKHPMVGQFRQ